MQQKVIMIIIAIVMVAAAVGGAWYYFTKGGEAVANNANQNSAATADLFANSQGSADEQAPQAPSELPDVVAKVGGQEITKQELQQAEAQILAGQQMDPSSLDAQTMEQIRVQALDGIISNNLLKQIASEADINVEAEAIDAQINNIKAQFTEEGQFESMLQQQNLTQEQLRELVSKDLEVQKYLEQTLGLLDISTSEEEISQFYQEQSSASEQELPPLEEVSEQIKTMLIQQKQQQVIMSHLQELKNNAEIEVLI